MHHEVTETRAHIKRDEEQTLAWAQGGYLRANSSSVMNHQSHHRKAWQR
jgi:hypothetical protein